MIVWFVVTNLVWFALTTYLLWEWRQMINLNREVLELNHLLMALIDIPQESDLYDQDGDVDR